MAVQSMIIGSIEGISIKDYNRLKPELNESLDDVRWKSDMLLIRSSREHGPLKELFSRIADCVQPDCFGSLLYVGHGNVACFYFAHGKYVGRKYKEPTPPEWWKP